MDLNVWTDSDVDRTRIKRLGVGYVVGVALVAGLFVLFTSSAATAAREEEEEILDVELAQSPEEEELEPEDEEPEPEAIAPKAKPKSLAAPTAIPDDKPAEVDATAEDLGEKGEDPYAASSQADEEEAREAVASAPPPPPPPKPKVVKQAPKPKKPKRLTKDMTPPKALAQSQPGYPASAKADGIEGTVIVKYVITATGAVTGVKAVRGPSALRGVCVSAVRQWRFEPAVLDGRPVSIRRTARFAFRIRT